MEIYTRKDGLEIGREPGCCDLFGFGLIIISGELAWCIYLYHSCGAYLITTENYKMLIMFDVVTGERGIRLE